MKYLTVKNTTSTMDTALTLLKKEPTLLEEGFVVLANKQTKGRGQYGNSWQSESEDGLYYSFVIKPRSFNVKNIDKYQFSIASCVKDVIKKFSSIESDIKLPNDVLIDGKKVSGILLESGSKMGSKTIDYLIIGVGLNVNQEHFPVSIKNLATSLYQHTQEKYDKLKIAKELTKQLKTKFI
ncbi:biotin--[acetyl-CoA-carboxylase] ligase [Candidatus Marinamargulisbacteria bacterium SCGC AAA071-K20]|nr:biotin--[acetyl-CoA-carboxylase] ligase [Candidatus Marinamargulisbacteria bacterium SCGC AAA071-K20]